MRTTDRVLWRAMLTVFSR